MSAQLSRSSNDAWTRSRWARAKAKGAALRVGAALGVLATASACERAPDAEPAPSASAAARPPAPRPTQAPQLLALPPAPEELEVEEPPRRCPAEMVDVGGAYCIDRFEMSLVDARLGRDLSPFYQPTLRRTKLLHTRWLNGTSRATTSLGRSLEIPEPPAFQLLEDFAPKALSRSGVRPNGYLTRDLADAACVAAGKRLCSREEWVHACRGEGDTRFPYGPEYQAGVCNVDRASHPAQLLHGDASIHHLDPRLPLVEAEDGPLLRSTGSTQACASRWGDDAVYDMVGNLDEWIDEPDGTFLGGFYSRGTRSGCDAAISSHRPDYFDYSLGSRCCDAIER